MGFFVSKKNGEFIFKFTDNYETRNESTVKIIRLADGKYKFPDFPWIYVNTGDVDTGPVYNGCKVFSYSSMNNDFSRAIPDFIFDAWPQVKIGDYEKITQTISANGNYVPEYNVIGWRGAMTHPNRQYLLRYTDKSRYDIEEIRWDRTNPNNLTCPNYISIEDSVKKWRYLIDVEGNGYSARVKLFLFSKRVLFLQERKHQEWFYAKLVPWKHYVPVKWNLEDLDEKFDYIKNNPDVEHKIRSNAYEFAINNLQREHALQRWKEVFHDM